MFSEKGLQFGLQPSINILTVPLCSWLWLLSCVSYEALEQMRPGEHLGDSVHRSSPSRLSLCEFAAFHKCICADECAHKCAEEPHRVKSNSSRVGNFADKAAACGCVPQRNLWVKAVFLEWCVIFFLQLQYIGGNRMHLTFSLFSVTLIVPHQQQNWGVMLTLV